MTEKKRKTKGTADIIDKHVGNRIRIRRALIGISQEKLANHVGVTFQQVQKYERGTNRVSASRLFQIANFLGVPIDYFYKGVEGVMQNTHVPEEIPLKDLDLLRIFYNIKDKSMRLTIVRLIKKIGNDQCR